VRTDTIEVRGMMCGGCEQRVRDALAALPGVVSSTPEHIGDEVEVTWDPQVVGMDEIRSAIVEAGFSLTPLPSATARTGSAG
jgi:copper chaperone CopZ